MTIKSSLCCLHPHQCSASTLDTAMYMTRLYQGRWSVAHVTHQNKSTLRLLLFSIFLCFSWFYLFSFATRPVPSRSGHHDFTAGPLKRKQFSPRPSFVWQLCAAMKVVRLLWIWGDDMGVGRLGRWSEWGRASLFFGKAGWKLCMGNDVLRFCKDECCKKLMDRLWQWVDEPKDISYVLNLVVSKTSKSKQRDSFTFSIGLFDWIIFWMCSKF